MKIVYYIKERSLNFYNENGIVAGGFIGDIAKKKFMSLLKRGIFPRISLGEVKMALSEGGFHIS
ncbi:MAG: hypothetical protein PUF10_02795 [Bacteroidales bacterium]|nr:hypothetical protein [Bacteroidales bacterium]